MTVKLQGRSAIKYCSFEKWDDANSARRTILNVSDSTCYCAPQAFFFTPHRKWYLTYQVGVPSAKMMWVGYSTTETLADPASWTSAQTMLDGGADDPRTVRGSITGSSAMTSAPACSRPAWTAGCGDCGFASRIFHAVSGSANRSRSQYREASHTCKLKGRDQYLTIIKENARRYYKACLADQLDGFWKPVADTSERPFAGWINIRPVSGVDPWTDNVCHGEILRDRRLDSRRRSRQLPVSVSRTVGQGQIGQ